MNEKIKAVDMKTETPGAPWVKFGENSYVWDIPGSGSLVWCCGAMAFAPEVGIVDEKLVRDY